MIKKEKVGKKNEAKKAPNIQNTSCATLQGERRKTPHGVKLKRKGRKKI